MVIEKSILVGSTFKRSNFVTNQNVCINRFSEVNKIVRSRNKR